MDSRSFGQRLLVGVILLLGLVAASSMAAGAQEVGSVTIHKVECPAGFDGEAQADLYNTCYFNPVSGQSFSSQQGKSDEAPVVATTDADGLVSLPLFGGTTIISEGLPQGVSEYFVFCSHEDGSAVEFEYTGDSFGIFLEQEGGDYYGNGSHIRCDWYNIPTANGGDGVEGTLTLFRVACPAGYQGDDYYDDCYDNPVAGAQFGLKRQNTDSIAGFSTGPDGAARAFLGISNPATMIVIDSTGGLLDGQVIPYLDYVVVCTKNGGEPVAIDYGQPGVMDIVFDAVPGDAIACDWFYVPPAQDGSDDDGGGSDGGDDGEGPVIQLPSTGVGGTADETGEAASIGLALIAILTAGVAAERRHAA